jgi:hypothetical protein
VATQLDVPAREQEENEGSSSEGSVLPGMQGIFLKQASRDLELATVMKGGVKQGCKPSWNFTGMLPMTYGNRRGLSDPVTVPDKSTKVAGENGYHTTVTPWTSRLERILRHCFRELDTMDEHEWEHQMQCALKWPDLTVRMRLIQSMKELEIQNVELPTWFVMDLKGVDDWLTSTRK